MKRNIWMLIVCIAVIYVNLTGCGGDPAASTPVPTLTAEVSSSPSPEPTPNPTTTPSPEPTEPPEDTFVLVTEYIPGIIVELRYATGDNFTGKVIYDFKDAWLRYGTVKKLGMVQEELEKQGFRLKIWDAFRPVSAQFVLWEAVPDSRYVANPNKGYSNHSRGNTVDVTLTDQEGNEMEMPTGFDDFSARADRDYSDVAKTAAENAKLLEEIMVDCGFRPGITEWWHYSDLDDYDVAEDFEPGIGG